MARITYKCSCTNTRQFAAVLPHSASWSQCWMSWDFQLQYIRILYASNSTVFCTDRGIKPDHIMGFIVMFFALAEPEWAWPLRAVCGPWAASLTCLGIMVFASTLLPKQLYRCGHGFIRTQANLKILLFILKASVLSGYFYKKISLL